MADTRAYDLARARRVGAILRRHREEAGMTQERLLDKLGMNPDNRAWVREVEKGERYRGNLPTILSPVQYVDLALAVDADPIEILTAARIPQEDWPELSAFEGVYAPTIDASGLTERQIRILDELASELRASNIAQRPKSS